MSLLYLINQSQLNKISGMDFHMIRELE